MIKPKRLRKGDLVAVMSLSWGGPALFADVYENGLRYLETQLGLRVKEFKTARMNDGELHDNPQLRAADLNAAFADPEVKAIISTIGGDDSIRILQYLDLDLIQAHPKILMGFSDTTTLLCYLNLKGLVTYYGNSVMAGFSYLENFPDARREYEGILFTNQKYSLHTFDHWADSYEPWGDKANVGKVSQLYTIDRGHRWINKGQVEVGQLWGGCIEVLVMMNGTLAWPHLDFWEGKILMIETSEDKPSPLEVAFTLRNFGIQGILNKLKGLLVAKPKGYSLEDKQELDREILAMVLGEFGCRDLNIVTNLEFGHTDPRHIMPLGINLEINPQAETLTFVEELFD